MLLHSVNTFTQCDSNYFSLTYTSSYNQAYNKAVVTPTGDIITLGNLYLPQGWMTKITGQGNVVWSNSYFPDYEGNDEKTFNHPVFTGMVASSATSVAICGSMIRDWNYVINDAFLPPPVNVGFISNIDQSGNILWSRELICNGAFNTSAPATYCTSIYTLKDGSIIAYLAAEKYYKRGLDGYSYGKIICFNKDGSEKWRTTLNTGEYDISEIANYIGRAISQTKNGNIIIADGVNKRNPDVTKRKDVPSVSTAIHLFSLNQNDGKMLWETSYDIGDPVTNPLISFKNITELPNGNLSFITYLNISANGQNNATPKPVNIITSSTGDLIKTISYSLPDDACFIVGAQSNDNNGNQTLLFAKQSDNMAVLAKIDADGKVTWSKGYHASLYYPPVCFSIMQTGYMIGFSSSEVKSTQVLITDKAGNIDCADSNISVMAEDVNFNYQKNLVTTINAGSYDDFSILPFAIKIDKLKQNANTDCKKFIACCEDIIDTSAVTAVDLCEGENYMLPDKRDVTTGGNYDVTLKTAKGCDSIVFYNIDVYKNPSDLAAIADTCLGDADSIIISTTPGFVAYKWMNVVTEKPSYEIYKEGTYYVTVTNFCGTKTDSVHIYKDCDYPVYMPTAFTPNGDRLNDVYRVPPLNKNRLVKLSIYNRFGQLIFSTTDINKGWDGFYKSYPVGTGVYIYQLSMKGITGTPVYQKGTFMLMR